VDDWEAYQNGSRDDVPADEDVGRTSVCCQMEKVVEEEVVGFEPLVVVLVVLVGVGSTCWVEVEGRRSLEPDDDVVQNGGDVGAVDDVEVAVPQLAFRAGQEQKV
jgi:hypothetical protein